MKAFGHLANNLSGIVSRETNEKLENYLNLLIQWQKTINLISNSTINQAWERHIWDSCQLYPFIKEKVPAIDLGSGGGFPGIVLAIMNIPITLVESDNRKTEFLKMVIGNLKLDAKVINGRVEHQDLSAYKIITARAFAPLVKLLATVEATLTRKHTLLLLKGKNYRAEIELAKKVWKFDLKEAQSITDPQGMVLEIKNIHKRGLI